MSLFLIGTKTKKKSKSRRRGSAASKQRRQWDPQQIQRMWRIIGWTTFVMVIVGGWWFGEQSLKRYVTRTHSDLPQVRFVDLPVWLSGDLKDQLRATVAATLNPDPFDQLSLQETAAVLEANPWVRKVNRVQRHADGLIEVAAAYRQPVALIEARDGYHLISCGGVCLPLVYSQADAKRLGMVIIQGVHHSPPLAGNLWQGGDVRAGLRLAMLVADQPWKKQIAAVDVANYSGRLDRTRAHLKLMTRNVTGRWHQLAGVEWGRAPGEEQFYEPPATLKLQHIQRVLRQYSTLDAGGQIVDVSQDRVWIRPVAGGAAVRYTLDH